MRVKPCPYPNGGHLIPKCPGCGDSHLIGETWRFNGDLDRPTFSPSLLVRTGHHANPLHKDGDDCWCNYEQRYGEKPPFACYVCHSFIRDGKIEFLGDCTHPLAGQTADLPDVQQKGTGTHEQ